jgi:hypothetical protein
MSRRAHEQGDCNGDWTCIWCWYEIADETNNDTEQGDNE